MNFENIHVGDLPPGSKITELRLKFGDSKRRNRHTGMCWGVDAFFNNSQRDKKIISFYSGYNSINNSTIANCDANHISNIISAVYDDHEIFFDNSSEGNVDDIMSKIHEVIKITNIPPKKFYYIVGLDDPIECYQDFLNRNNIPKSNAINIVGLRTWENYSANSISIESEYNIRKKEKMLLCFNRVLRPHRIALTASLLEKNLMDRCYYSFFPYFTHNTTNEENLDQVYQCMNGLSGSFYNNFYLYANTIKKHEDKLPLSLNIKPQENKTWSDLSDLEYYDNSYFSVVTETNFFEWKNFTRNGELKLGSGIFFTEKTFKPILMKHPFILMSRPGILKSLRELGYRTFSPYIDEQYDSIENNMDRFNAILLEIERLSKYSDSDWLGWQNNIKEIVEHNFNIMKSKHKQPLEFFISKKNF